MVLHGKCLLRGVKLLLNDIRNNVQNSLKILNKNNKFVQSKRRHESARSRHEQIMNTEIHF